VLDQAATGGVRTATLAGDLGRGLPAPRELRLSGRAGRHRRFRWRTMQEVHGPSGLSARRVRGRRRATVHPRGQGDHERAPPTLAVPGPSFEEDCPSIHRLPDPLRPPGRSCHSARERCPGRHSPCTVVQGRAHERRIRPRRAARQPLSHLRVDHADGLRSVCRLLGHPGMEPAKSRVLRLLPPHDLTSSPATPRRGVPPRDGRGPPGGWESMRPSAHSSQCRPAGGRQTVRAARRSATSAGE
jgi:hypothetical protein